MRIVKISLGFTLVSLLGLSAFAVACGDDDAAPTSVITVPDAGPAGESTPDASATDSGSEAAAVVDNCVAATSTLAATADGNAPVLDAAKSSLVRVTSNDGPCAAHGGAFGAFGYQLSFVSTDADGDGRTSLDDVQASGAIRLASDPNIDIMTRFDATKVSTGGQAILIQLCLDKVYAPSELAIGVDYTDKANHRAKAICVRQQSGG